MIRVVRMKLHPNSGQRRFIDDTILVHCYVYNALITAVRLYFESNGHFPSENQLNSVCTRIWKNVPSFHGIYQNTMNCISKRVLRAYKKCNPSVRTRMYTDEDGSTRIAFELTKPRFKKPGRYKSFEYLSNRTFSIVPDSKGKRRCLKLGKMGGTLRCYNQNTPIDGIPKTCTVSRENSGTHCEYWASIVYDTSYETNGGTEWFDGEKPECIGVDMGVSNIAVTSDGRFFRNDRPYEEMSDKLKNCHRRMSSSPVHSEERKVALSRLAHAYRRLTNRRREVCDTIANDIVESADVICMEDLSVKGLRSISKNEYMTNMYNDALLGELRRRISYKAIGADKKVVLVEPKGTSQICSRCGSEVKKDLAVREHVCPNCGLVMDRDLNASINILYRGMGKLGWTGHPVPPDMKGTNSPVMLMGAQRMSV